jgi:hypothetical protein
VVSCSVHDNHARVVSHSASIGGSKLVVFSDDCKDRIMMSPDICHSGNVTCVGEFGLFKNVVCIGLVFGFGR